MHESRSGGRCFVSAVPNHELGLRAEERKVRTLKGSEPANGGAFEDIDFKSEISDLEV